MRGNDPQWFHKAGNPEIARVASDDGIVTYHNRLGFEIGRETFGTREAATRRLEAQGWEKLEAVFIKES